VTTGLFNASSSETVSSRRRRWFGGGWLREPLLHFVVLGGLLFVVDHFVNRRSDDAHTIVVGPDVDREAIETFKANRNREPTAQELTALRQVWLDNEVLYREGLALQLDRGDTGIRERVIFKALSMIDSNVKLPPADDAVLRNWFDTHRDRYDEAASFEAFRGVVMQDWTDETAAQQRTNAVRNLTKKYDVKYEVVR
jgi:hypothetical protein